MNTPKLPKIAYEQVTEPDQGAINTALNFLFDKFVEQLADSA